LAVARLLVLDTLEAREKFTYNPNTNPVHAFDFKDGLRIFVTRERLGPPVGEVVRFGAVAVEGTPLWTAISSGALPGEDCLPRAVRYFRTLSGYDGAMVGPVFSGHSGIPNWLIPAERMGDAK
jgi:hypothetical protein